MKYLNQLMIILSAYFLGEILHLLLKLTIPGNVLGMIILFAALITGIVKVEMINEVGEFLLSHLSFFFIPAGVGLITSFAVLKGYWISVLIICLITTVTGMLAAGFTVKMLKGRNRE